MPDVHAAVILLALWYNLQPAKQLGNVIEY